MTRPAKGRSPARTDAVASHYRWTQALVDGLAQIDRAPTVMSVTANAPAGEIPMSVADELIIRGCAVRDGLYVRSSALGKATMQHLRNLGWVPREP